MLTWYVMQTKSYYAIKGSIRSIKFTALKEDFLFIFLLFLFLGEVAGCSGCGAVIIKSHKKRQEDLLLLLKMVK